MAIGGIIGLIGSAVSAFGTIAGANAQAAGLEYQAKVAREKGKQEQAAAQRGALDTERKAKYAQSTLQARAAGSGAGASDPTVTDLAQDISGRGKYQSGLQMWQGAERKWDYETEAIGKQAQASATRSAAPFSAFGTLLGGAGSLFKSAGNGGFGGFSFGSNSGAKDKDDYTEPYWLYR